MLKYKNIHEKGKFSLARFFQKFNKGDFVAVVRNLTFPLSYSKRLQGRTGQVIEKRGSAYYVEIKDLDKKKRYAIRPIHLKKIEVNK